MSARVAPTQVRCAAGFSGVSLMMRETVACVRSRVDPPAPYVTDTNDGDSGARRSIERQSVCSISSVFGGKNSNDARRPLSG